MLKEVTLYKFGLQKVNRNAFLGACFTSQNSTGWTVFDGSHCQFSACGIFSEPRHARRGEPTEWWLSDLTDPVVGSTCADHVAACGPRRTAPSHQSIRYFSGPFKRASRFSSSTSGSSGFSSIIFSSLHPALLHVRRLLLHCGHQRVSSRHSPDKLQPL